MIPPSSGLIWGLEMEILYQGVIQGVLIGSTYGLIALSMGLIYGVSGITNFAQGDLMVLCMFMTLTLSTLLNLDPYVSILITMPVIIAVTAVVYRYLIQPISSQQLMVIQLTLGLMFVIQNGILMVYGGNFQRVPSVLDGDVLVIGDFAVVQTSLLISFVATWGLAGVLFWTLGYTDFGRSVRAVHQNAKAAALVGVDVRRTQLIVVSLSAAILAVSASLLVAGRPIHPGEGLHYTVVALMPFVLGGMNNLLSILVSGIIIGVAETLGNVYLNGPLGFAVPYAVFIAILIFRPQGLFGSRS
ncbi:MULTISPECIES: branched-chain amino acid ABC transporter permease [Bradyrhizobium]|uniref:branched-chain amino acid ABC transporter permease n=1 Tax=Bradyrhizobium TaxID=374 RepID=UPI001FD8B1B7|nr:MULTISPECIES: branched-chain amino acid ABC transporter permease [Bradyrhizobium]